MKARSRATRHRWLPCALTLVVAAGCGGRDNETACLDAVAAHNAAYEECGLEDRLDPDVACPPGLESADKDCTEYFDRLAESYQCGDDGVVRFDARGSCE